MDMTLLERIQALDRGERDSGGYGVDRLSRSIVRHLASLFNTRRGSVPIAPDYGIADMTDLGRAFTQESIDEIMEELERVALKYEPRLSAVRLKYAPRPDLPLSAVFSLEASIGGENAPATLRLETLLDASGTVRLREEEARGVPQ